MKHALFIGGAVSALLLAACSNADVTSPPAAPQLSAADTAQAAAMSASDATSEDVNLMSASEASMDSPTPAYDLISASPFAATSTAPSPDSTRYAFWGASQGCTYNASTGRFACPDVTQSGLTLSRSAAFFDANGAAMAHYDALLTDSANFQMTVSGVHTTADGADTVSRQRTMTVTGLLGQETSRTWNGTGTRTDGGYRQDTLALRTYHTRDNVTFANVVVNLPRSQNPWPMSGTVTRQIAGAASVVRSGTTRTFTVAKTVTITFNGTRYVPMSVGTVQFTLDLYTGKATKNAA
jgi:hypothetical protein